MREVFLVWWMKSNADLLEEIFTSRKKAHKFIENNLQWNYRIEVRRVK